MRTQQRPLLFLRLILVVLLVWATGGQAQAAGERTLTLLFTNDTHNRLDPFQHVELKKQVGGVLRRQRYFEQVKRQTDQTLILDAGDVFQGTPYYNFYLGEPDIKAMNLLGYQAMTVGNHDLDNGLLNLKKQTQYAWFPVLNANIVDEKTGLLVFRPFEIFDVHGIKVAVIGLMSEHAWQAVMAANKQGLRFRDPVAVANELVPQLRPHVDLIVTLHHMGIWVDEEFPKQVAGVDVIIGGHSHTLMEKARLIPNGNSNGIGGTLMQHAYFMGAYVGRIDLTLDLQGKIVKYDSQLVLLDDSFDRNPLQEMLSSYGDKLKASMGEVIGESLDDMGLDGKYNGPFALGSLIADVLRESQGTEVGIMNTGGVRSGLVKGPISVGSIYEVMPFDNTISTFKLKGKDLRRVVETSISRLGVSKNLQFSGLVYSLRGKQLAEIRV
ncbi:MAG: bifunctional UDP-sugar hydrolase/5'-nucleotidase, partial [Candidatus Sericytochromatia bacterium]